MDQRNLRKSATIKTILGRIVFVAAIIIAPEVYAAPNNADAFGVVRAGQFTPPPNQAGKSGYLSLMHQRQETNLCVPTSASMVLQHFGCPATPRELKTLSRRQQYDPTKKFNDFTLTFFPDLVAGISTLGFSWQVQTYPNTKAGARTGLAEIIKSIDLGNPVLIDTNLYGGHTFVVSGYDGGAQNLIIIDPNLPAPGIRILSYRDIEKIWNSRGVGFNGRGAVFTAPK